MLSAVTVAIMLYLVVWLPRIVGQVPNYSRWMSTSPLNAVIPLLVRSSCSGAVADSSARRMRYGTASDLQPLIIATPSSTTLLPDVRHAWWLHQSGRRPAQCRPALAWLAASDRRRCAYLDQCPLLRSIADFHKGQLALGVYASVFGMLGLIPTPRPARVLRRD